MIEEDFDRWFKYYIGCDWEDFEGNLDDGDMFSAFAAGMEYAKELKQC